LGSAPTAPEDPHHAVHGVVCGDGVVSTLRTDAPTLGKLATFGVPSSRFFFKPILPRHPDEGVIGSRQRSLILKTANAGDHFWGGFLDRRRVRTARAVSRVAVIVSRNASQL
jgi:hypothetical protein